jgi:hypothetical protein
MNLYFQSSEEVLQEILTTPITIDFISKQSGEKGLVITTKYYEYFVGTSNTITRYDADKVKQRCIYMDADEYNQIIAKAEDHLNKSISMISYGTIGYKEGPSLRTILLPILEDLPRILKS